MRVEEGVSCEKISKQQGKHQDGGGEDKAEWIFENVSLKSIKLDTVYQQP